MPVAAVSKLERFFRAVAGLDLDKSDLKRHGEFVNRKLVDLLIRGQAIAKANGRDVVQPHDLPITKGLQERIHEFREADRALKLSPVLEELAERRPIDLALSDETEARLPEIAGGISVALAHSFKIMNSDLPNPQTEHWERAHRFFDLLL
jgi:Domain of unknown function (DUF1931)